MLLKDFGFMAARKPAVFAGHFALQLGKQKWQYKN
jgi:hypothetical protein